MTDTHERGHVAVSLLSLIKIVQTKEKRKAVCVCVLVEEEEEEACYLTFSKIMQQALLLLLFVSRHAIKEKQEKEGNKIIDFFPQKKETRRNDSHSFASVSRPEYF